MSLAELQIKKSNRLHTKEWTGMDFASSTRTAENRTRWEGIVANSSVMPRRSSKVMGQNRIEQATFRDNFSYFSMKQYIVTPH